MSLFNSDFLYAESGSVAITFGASAMLLAVTVGLALTAADGYNLKTKTQDALDAAVLAAAAMPASASESERIARAHLVYNQNKSSRGLSNPDFGVNGNSPATFILSETTVTGTIDLPVRSPFLGVLGHEIMTVSVASVARKKQGSSVCVLGLDLTEPATMDFNGEAGVDVFDCATQANSSDGTGLNQVGHPQLRAKDIGVTGGFSGTGYTPSPITGTTPVADPFEFLPMPSTGPCHPLSGQMLQQTTATLTPGTYCGGLWIKAQSVITLSPGEYIMLDGPLTIDSDAAVSGTEVMLAFNGPGATLYMQGNASLTVTSPTSGTYKNIQFFGDRTAYPGPGSNGVFGPNLWFTIIGNSTLKYDGVLYTPSFHVWWAGGSIVEAQSPNYIAIAKKLWFQDKTQARLHKRNARGLSVPEAARLESGAVLIK
jgi:Flp pilus assembly protein TadG